MGKTESIQRKPTALGAVRQCCQMDAAEMQQEIREAGNTELQEYMGAGVTAAAASLTVAIGAAVELFTRALRDAMPKIQEWARMASLCSEWENAQRWATACRPDWVAIYRRTKKRRIKKKYADRILRWYRTEVAPHG